MTRWTSLALAGLLLALLAPAAQADPGVTWNPAWHRVRPWEYVVGQALLGSAVIVRLAGPQLDDPNWTGGILFDDAVRDVIAVRGSARGSVELLGDLTFLGGMGYRLLDSAILPGVIHGSWDVALQMSFIDVEAYGIVGAVLWGSQLFIGRERPFVSVCRDDPEYAARVDDCEPKQDWNRSFIAGHFAVAMTTAGLTCLHHSHMPLYGGAGDGVACGVSIAAAALTAYSRVAVERHYTSDVIMGLGLGFIAGYLVPKTLHYGWGSSSSEPSEPAPQGQQGTLLPTFAPDRVGLTFMGRM